jgi:hypothetical protein
MTTADAWRVAVGIVVGLGLGCLPFVRYGVHLH